MSNLLYPFLRFAGEFPHFGQGSLFSIAYDCRMIFILGEGGTFFTEKGHTPLHRFDLLYIPPAVPYRLDSAGRLDLAVVNFDFTSMHCNQSDPLHPSSPKSFDPAQVTEYPPSQFQEIYILHHMQELKSLFERLIHEKRAPDDKSSEMTSHLLAQCLIMVERAVKHPLSDKEQRLVANLIKYLTENATKKPSDATIAAHFAYHPYYLNRILKKHTGETIHAYLLHERIRLACAMLRAGENKNETIAHQVGFENVSHFIKVFKKHTGMTPSEYRKTRATL